MQYLKVPLRVLQTQDWVETPGTLVTFPKGVSRTAARDYLWDMGLVRLHRIPF